MAAAQPDRAPRSTTSRRRTYDALRQDDPRRLLAVTQEPLPGLPYLAAAIRRLLEERPWCGPGLARSERQILQAVAEGARTRVEAFTASWQMEQAPYMGDSWIFRRIDELREQRSAAPASRERPSSS